MNPLDSQSPPHATGSFDDARQLAEWDFLRKTPTQRLQWLIDMLTIGYATGAFKPVNERRKDAVDPNGILSPVNQGIWPAK